MESQPQNPEFRNNPENVHPWDTEAGISYGLPYFSSAHAPIQMVSR